MVPIDPSKSPNAISLQGANIFFVHQGEFEGRYVFLTVDSFGNTEVYESPSTLRNSGRDGFPSQSFFPKGQDGSLAELIGSSDAELVDPRAWGKWEYFFGITPVTEPIMTNSLITGSRDVYQPIRDDHFKLLLGTFDGYTGEQSPTGTQRYNADLPSKRKSRNVYVEFIRLYLLAKGLAIYVVPDQAEVLWFSDNYGGIHTLSAETIVSGLGRQGGQEFVPKRRFLNTWVEAEPVQSDWATESLFESNLLSERSFRVWFESSPIHRMRLGLSYFEKIKVASESFHYLNHLLGRKFTSIKGETMHLAVAPWFGRTILVRE